MSLSRLSQRGTPTTAAVQQSAGAVSRRSVYRRARQLGPLAAERLCRRLRRVRKRPARWCADAGRHRLRVERSEGVVWRACGRRPGSRRRASHRRRRRQRRLARDESGRLGVTRVGASVRSVRSARTQRPFTTSERRSRLAMPGLSMTTLSSYFAPAIGRQPPDR
jgi:hypothetical protein